MLKVDVSKRGREIFVQIPLKFATIIKVTDAVASVAGLVISASGCLFEVDILELSRFPWPGVGICRTSIG